MLDSGDYFGFSIASTGFIASTGDLDADGVGDLAAGAYLDCRSGSNQGAEPDACRPADSARLLPQVDCNPRNFDPTTQMPSFEGTEDELQDGVEDLLTLE